MDIDKTSESKTSQFCLLPVLANCINTQPMIKWVKEHFLSVNDEKYTMYIFTFTGQSRQLGAGNEIANSSCSGQNVLLEVLIKNCNSQYHW